ncbi:Gfo/Idh/MocA family protein [Nakamurella endophytica]|uniref:Oxidoreductase n=1 Tax=Nakamurella endophytica TaxID=1748367 RepID=A0A917WEA5_9ACTN|nr:Gfo/Idh/MocA family oxidoreductase [Nakamurella endophytica]GGL97544.1 oxidoreductase [Nakamurella endophytica]
MTVTATGPVRVGIVGAGDVSAQYLDSLRQYPDIEVTAIADLDTERARERAETYRIERTDTVDGLLGDQDLELLVNLTPPAQHVPLSLAAVKAGKHVWSEKPLGTDRAGAESLLRAATDAGVLVGCAPDTILGRGIQSSARHLADGRIGAPHTVLTLMQGPGPESWHPRPEFFYRAGAGPLFDIGPYYVATLAMLLGSVARVTAKGHRASPTRTIGSGPDAGRTFDVEVSSHVSVLTEFESGVVGTSIYSFDSPVRRQLFEVTGAAGTLTVPVSGFDGVSDLVAAGGPREAAAVALPPEGTERDRGVGALDLARAIRSGAGPRCSGDLARHALDVLLAIEESIASGGSVPVTSMAPPVELVDSTWDPREQTL